jgi:hypothetical protein
MGSTNNFVPEAIERPEGLRSRRGFLSGAALATAGGAAVASLVRPEMSFAASTDGFNGWNDVTNVAFAGGAQPNNPSVDSAPAIQDCLNQSVLTPTRGAVYFPPGTYYIGSTLLIPNGSFLIGHGSLSVIAVKSGSDLASHYPMMQAAGATATGTDVQIENLKLDSSNRTLITGNAHCIFFGSGSERVFIRRVECFATPGAGIFLSGVKLLTVQDCHVHKCAKDGIAVWSGSDQVIVQGNLVHDNGDDHISVVSAVGTPPSKRISILDNVISNVDPATNYTGAATKVGSSIALRLAEQVKIVGNVVRGGYRAAIELNTAAGAVRDVEIVGNFISEAGNHLPPEAVTGVGGGSAILVHVPGANPAERINIQDNSIVAPRHHGVFLKVTSGSSGDLLRDVAIEGNMLRFDVNASYRAGNGSGVACIDPNKPVTDVKISGNTILESAGPGIYAKGPATAITNLRRWDIQDNKVSDSGRGNPGQAGIDLQNVESLTVIGNRAQDRTGVQNVGLSVVNPQGNVVVADNDFVENGQAPIVYSANSFAPARLRIRDNPGFNPWTGEAPLSPTGWNGSGPFTQEVPVTFGNVRFPNGKPPKVLATVQDIDAYAIAKNVTESGFTLRVVSATNPGTQQKAGWVAEPLDT